MKSDLVCAIISIAAVIGFFVWLFFAAIERDERLAALYEAHRAAQFSRAH